MNADLPLDLFVHDVIAGAGDGIVITDPDVVESYSRDSSSMTETARAGAVVLPRSTAEVSVVMRAAHAHRVSVVIRGAGTGMVGGANAIGGCVVLSTARMNELLEVDPTERIAVAQPGLVTARLRDAAARQGLFYPPDPGSVESSSIGGNVATNAGGMCCVKYGVTADFVLAVEAVLADGTVLRAGRRTVKGVAGYDLTRLLVGSEGTLAVITEVTVRLLPAPLEATTLVATFDRLEDAGRAVEAIVRAGLSVSMLELMDTVTLEAVERRTRMGLGEPAAMLIVQSDSGRQAEELAQVAELCRGVGAAEVAVSEDAEESAALVEARRQVLPALEQQAAADGQSWLLDDVCVPRSRVVDLVTRIHEIGREQGVCIAVYGHAGDGNMHPTILFDQHDEAEAERARNAFAAVTTLALDLGGTITGEHGIGRLKAAWLAHELDEGSLRVSAAVKAALDPRGILNPGAVLAL